ncbi:MAG: hypothetical protein A4E35_00019 [Methanoregula sp. PtaU1.Bin051]|nr:MAG: hypothetical protein A4E35_00019 [Methanoregula sp. PtaU1.Bin051]
MPRELTEKDIGILKKLVPEFEETACPGSGHMFQSILPPVSNHFATDGKDFAERIARLSDDELQYLTGLIFTGDESLGCIAEEDLDSFILLVKERLSPEEAKKVLNAYAVGGTCELD